MRLFTISCLAFGLIGIALYYQDHLGLGPAPPLSSAEEMQEVFSAGVPSDVHLAYASATPDTPDPTGGSDALVVTAHRSNEAILLSGFPSYATVRFPLPQDRPAKAGLLNLDLDVQLAAGGSGALRITIGGRRRGEVIFEPGLKRRSVSVPLEANDLLGPELVVALAAAGRSADLACPTLRDTSFVASVAASSSLSLDVDALSFEDRWRTLALPVPVTVPAGEPNAAAQAETLRLAATLERDGVPTRFVARGSASEPALTVDPQADGPFAFDLDQGVLRLRSAELASGIVRLRHRTEATALLDTSVRRFRDAVDWRIPLGSLQNLALEAPPRRFDVAIRLDEPLDEDIRLTAKLNADTLLERGPQRMNDGVLRTSILLPSDAVRAQNELVISLDREGSTKESCPLGQGASAQLLLESEFAGRIDGPPTPWFDMIATLRDARSIALEGMTDLSPGQLDLAVDMLAAILPDQGDRSGTVRVTLRLLDHAAVRSLLDSYVSEDRESDPWLVAPFYQEDGTWRFDSLPLRRARRLERMPPLSVGAVYLLVERGPAA